MSDVDVSFGAEHGEFASDMDKIADDFKETLKMMENSAQSSFSKIETRGESMAKKIAFDVGAMAHISANHFDVMARDAQGSMAKIDVGGNKVMGSLGGIAGGLRGLLPLAGAAGLGMLATKVVQTSAEFERLRSVLATLEGEDAANSRFQELKKFAAETPFDLQQVVTAFTMLKSQGLDPSMESLRAYGNISAGMGKNMLQFVEAVGDAVMGENERLKGFGINAKSHGDSIIYTFKGVSTTVKKDGKAIEEYLRGIGESEFGDAMERQMNTLNGAMSNAMDSAASFADAIGQGGLTSAITDVVNEFVEMASGGESLASTLGSVLGTTITTLWDVIKTLGSVVSSVFETMGDIIRWFTGDTTSNGEILTNVFKAVEIIVISFGLMVKTVFIIAGGIVKAGAAAIVGSLRAIGYALVLDWDSSIAAMKQWQSAVVGIANDTYAQVGQAYNDSQEQVNDVVARGPAAPPPPTSSAPSMPSTPSGVGGGVGGGAGGGAGSGARRNGGGGSSTPKKPESPLGGWKDELDWKKKTELKFYEDGLSMEEGFWRGKLKLLKEGTEDYKTVQGYLYDLEKERLRKLDETNKEMVSHGQNRNEELANQEADSAKAAINRERQKNDSLLSLGQITDQQHLARSAELDQAEYDAEAAHQERIYQIKKKGLQDQLDLLGLTPIEKRRVSNELEMLELEHQGNMAEIRRKADDAAYDNSSRSALLVQNKWQSSIQSVGATFEGFLQQMATGTVSFGQAVLRVADQLVASFISMGVKMVTNWVTNELVKTTATTTGVAVRTGAEAAGSTMSVAISAASTLKQVAHSAVKAASGAYAAIASIPVVGPFLAPAAAAAALYGVYRLGKSVMSARGGMGNVPYDDQPFLLHKEEMVLPSEFANPLRAALKGAGPQMSSIGSVGASGGSNDNSKNSVSNSMVYSPSITVPGQSLESLLKKESRAMIQWMENAVRNGEVRLNG